MSVIDPDLIEQLEKSDCFGLAHDAKNKYCKKCDLRMECAAKTRSNSIFSEMKSLNPDSKKAMEEAKEEEQRRQERKERRQQEKRQKKRSPSGMPNTKGWDVSQLEDFLKERGGTCKKFDNVAIYKMRLIMAIKKTYE